MKTPKGHKKTHLLISPTMMHMKKKIPQEWTWKKLVETKLKEVYTEFWRERAVLEKTEEEKREETNKKAGFYIFPKKKA